MDSGCERTHRIKLCGHFYGGRVADKITGREAVDRAPGAKVLFPSLVDGAIEDGALTRVLRAPLLASMLCGSHFYQHVWDPHAGPRCKGSGDIPGHASKWSRCCCVFQLGEENFGQTSVV